MTYNALTYDPPSDLMEIFKDKTGYPQDGLNTELDLANMRSDLPNSYVSVHLAGAGNNASVHYCLLKSSLTSAKRPTILQRNEFERLKSELVAIKMPMSHALAWGGTGKEIDALKEVAKHSASDTRSPNIIQLLDHDPDYVPCSEKNLECRWMAFSTSASTISLKQIIELSTGSLAQEFVLHVFIQMTEALHFLQETCKPPISHNDVNTGNIMIDLSKPDVLGFPEVVLIDFGNASIEGTDEEMRWDMVHCFQTVSGLASKATGSLEKDLSRGESNFSGFVDWLDEHGLDQAPEVSLDEMIDWAKNRRKEGDPYVLMGTTGMLRGMLENREQHVDNEIQRLLEVWYELPPLTRFGEQKAESSDCHILGDD